MAGKSKFASFSGPSAIKSEYLKDPRLIMAQELQKTGSSTAPVQSTTEGIARALQAMVGGYQQKQIQDEYQNRGEQYNADLSKALQTSQSGVPAWNNPDTGDQAIPAIAPGSGGLLAGLSSAKSPEVKEMGANAMMAQLLREPEKPNLPSGYRLNPTSGQAELIPGIDPSWGKRADPLTMPIVVVDKATGKQRYVTKDEAMSDPNLQPPPVAGAAPKEFELQSKGYADRMQGSGKIIGELEKSAFDPTNIKENVAGGVPGVGNFYTSPQYQSYKQGASDWIRAKLRKESGASISPAEMDAEYKTYFPIPGDGPLVIKQKAESRKQAEEAMVTNAGAAWTVQPPTTDATSPSEDGGLPAELPPVLPQPKSAKERDALSPGTSYKAPDGSVRVR